MSKYKRLTSDVGFARNLPINEELYDRLYYLENAIENGTLVELPCKVGASAVAIVDTMAYPNAIMDVKIEGLAYIVRDGNGDITFQHIDRIIKTEAEAREKLNSLKDEFAECRDCPAWSGSDCTRHPYNEGCLKEVNKEKNDNDL